MKPFSKTIGLVLAIHPTSYGYGWALFEGQLAPVDWGYASAKLGRNRRLMRQYERLLDRHTPAALVIEEFEGRGSAKSARNRDLCRALVDLAQSRGMDTAVYDRDVVQSYFAPLGARTRYEIAQAIALRIDALRGRLPAQRHVLSNGDGRLSLFDAAALAVTYFAVQGEDEMTAPEGRKHF